MTDDTRKVDNQCDAITGACKALVLGVQRWNGGELTIGDMEDMYHTLQTQCDRLMAMLQDVSLGDPPPHDQKAANGFDPPSAPTSIGATEDRIELPKAAERVWATLMRVMEDTHGSQTLEEAQDAIRFSVAKLLACLKREQRRYHLACLGEETVPRTLTVAEKLRRMTNERADGPGRMSDTHVADMMQGETTEPLCDVLRPSTSKDTLAFEKELADSGTAAPEHT